MNIKYAIFALALLVPSGAVASSPDELTEFVNLEIQQGAALTSEWTRDPGRTCGDVNVRTAWGKFDAAKRTVVDSSEQLSRPGWSETTRRGLNRVVRDGAPKVAMALLSLAATYHAGGCPAEAKSVYQDVLLTFTGSNYEAYRQVAVDGLADIRANK